MAKSIVVVDDAGAYGFTLSLLLRNAGHDVYCCGSAEEALRRLQERHADVLVSDIVMPGMSGDVLAVEVRRRWPNTKVVLMSGLPKEKVPPLPSGVAFLPKPVDVQRLLSALAGLDHAPPPPPPR